MPLMIEGYKKDLIKFAIITCRIPEFISIVEKQEKKKKQMKGVGYS